MKNSGNDAKSSESQEVGFVPVTPTSDSGPAISAHSPNSPSNTPSNELSRLEKLKFYTDLYKYYSELPFKIVAAYSVASTLIIALIAHFTKDLRVIGGLAIIIVVIEVFIGIRLAMFDRKHIEPYKDEIESLMNELGLSFGPNFHVMRFVLRLSVISLALLPPLAALLLFISFLVR